jgi:hypothetical protein
MLLLFYLSTAVINPLLYIQGLAAAITGRLYKSPAHCYRSAAEE